MKKLSDLDELLDLDEEDAFDETEDAFEEDVFEEEDDYEFEYAGNMPDKRILLLVIAVAVIGVAAVAAAVLLAGGSRKKEAAVETLVSSASGEAEPDSGETAGGQEQMAENDPTSDGTGTADQADAAADDTDKQNASAEAGETADDGEAVQEDAAQEQDPQTSTMSTEQGTEVNVTELLSSGSVAQTDQVTIGIDVARYQGTIDWEQVAASGIDFAMVRVGYRADKSREICADSNARFNMQEAQKHGIKVGAYFFSTATTTQEAVEEAGWVADYISQYQITYPVAYDCEGFDQPDSAQYGLTNAERTEIAIAFVTEINNRGYTPMFYSSMGELTGSAKWDTQRIEEICRVWVAQYPETPYPQTAKSSYTGAHVMWQYTNRGTVAGISKPVDVNVAYFGYEGTAQARSDEAPEEAKADVEALMNFTQVSENVTAKDSTNLRDIPSQGADSRVVYTLKNGEAAARTGVSDSGWSRLIIDGERYYAVSNYLTADLSYRPPVKEPDDGLKTKFQSVSENVTPKIEINLRKLPSVTNPDAAVVATVRAGEVFVRTGINTDYGWSRVEYNGQTLYCVSSYLTTAE